MFKILKCNHHKCEHNARFRDRHTGAMHCKDHRTSTSFNFRDSKCIVSGCNGWQIYNFLGGRALFCADHKCSDMHNANKVFKGHRCFILDCENMCCSAFPVCKIHKPKKMKNVKRNRIDISQLPQFYEKQRIEAAARLKYMINIPDLDFKDLD